MIDYNLGFISNENLYDHVKETVNAYRLEISMKEFTKSIDPIKLTFDSIIYNKSMGDILKEEMNRQIDKSNTNHIGYFHQNIFKYFSGWEVLDKGYDVVNKELGIYVEMKNRYNTINHASSHYTYIKMEDTLRTTPNSTCMLVTAMSNSSHDKIWEKTINKTKKSNSNIRIVSIDKFYELVTGDELAFKKMCEILPIVTSDIVHDGSFEFRSNNIIKDLEDSPESILKLLYINAFGKYNGFRQFNLHEDS